MPTSSDALLSLRPQQSNAKIFAIIYDVSIHELHFSGSSRSATDDLHTLRLPEHDLVAGDDVPEQSLCADSVVMTR